MLPWEKNWAPAEQQMRREKPTVEASYNRSSEILDQLEELMSQHGEDVAQVLQGEEEDAFVEFLQKDREEKQGVLDSMVEQASMGEIQRVQMLKERSLVQASWKRSDRILSMLLKKRREAAAKKKAAAAAEDLKSLESQWRAIRKREKIAAGISSQAEYNRDKDAWERAWKITDKLFQEREAIRTKIKKINPKREEQLYNELYLER